MFIQNWEEGKSCLKKDLDLNTNKALREFQAKKSHLFDIAICKCSRVSCDKVKCDQNDCKENYLICKCNQTIPKIELPFLFDQRTKRRFHIGNSVDVQTSKSLEKKAEWLEQLQNQVKNEEERKKNEGLEQQLANEVWNTLVNEEGESSKNSKDEEDWRPQEKEEDTIQIGMTTLQGPLTDGEFQAKLELIL